LPISAWRSYSDAKYQSLVVRLSLIIYIQQIPEETDGLLHQADMRMYEDKATHKFSGKKKIESESQSGKLL
jgi:hypothetical protein